MSTSTEAECENIMSIKRKRKEKEDAQKLKNLHDITTICLMSDLKTSESILRHLSRMGKWVERPTSD